MLPLVEGRVASSSYTNLFYLSKCTHWHLFYIILRVIMGSFLNMKTLIVQHASFDTRTPDNTVKFVGRQCSVDVMQFCISFKKRIPSFVLYWSITSSTSEVHFQRYLASEQPYKTEVVSHPGQRTDLFIVLYKKFVFSKLRIPQVWCKWPVCTAFMCAPLYHSYGTMSQGHLVLMLIVLWIIIFFLWPRSLMV